LFSLDGVEEALGEGESEDMMEDVARWRCKVRSGSTQDREGELCRALNRYMGNGNGK
jgi:hypothetical protein